MPQPSINHVKVAGQGDNMPPPKENPGPWQSTTIKCPHLQNMPMDITMSQMDAMDQTTRDKQAKDTTSEQLDTMGLATNDQQSQDTTPEQMGTTRPRVQELTVRMGQATITVNLSMAQEERDEASLSISIRNEEQQETEKEEERSCQGTGYEPSMFDNQELEQDMYTMMVDMEEQMKQERLRRAEKLKKEEEDTFLNTVLAVEEKEARKARQATLSALAKEQETAREQEWLKEALSFEESRRNEIEEGAETTQPTPTIPVPNLQAGTPSGATMPPGEESYWDNADVQPREQEDQAQWSESSPARPWTTTLQCSTLKKERTDAKPEEPACLSEQTTTTMLQLLGEQATANMPQARSEQANATMHQAMATTSMQHTEKQMTTTSLQPSEKEMPISSLQPGTELGTGHGHEEQPPPRTPSSPPPSRARKEQQRKDRMIKRRKDQRRLQMSSSRNLSPEDVGATAIVTNPEAIPKPTKPTTGQELSPSKYSKPRDPPKQPIRHVGTYVPTINHHQTSTLSPRKKASMEQTQPDRKSAGDQTTTNQCGDF